MLGSRPDLLLLAGIGVVFAVYPTLTRTRPLELELDREVSSSAPADGDTVTVTVRVKNVGDRFYPDLRVVDGVPPALRVVDGSPRKGIALRPGGTSTFTYAVTARRGRHSFEAATIASRDLSGAHEHVISVASETEIHCTDDLTRAPLRAHSLVLAGHVNTNDPGTGIEFHRTRDYQQGDPINRIDWNRYARTGQLTTVEFDEERAVSVMIIVDARAQAYRGRADRPHAVAQSVTGARQLVYSLHAHRNWVGVCGLGREFCWLDPGVGREHLEEVDRFITRHETFSSIPPHAEAADQVELDHIQHRLRDGNVQLIVLTPLCDDDIVDSCLRLHAAGHPVTVISPDVTGGTSTGALMAKLGRSNRIASLARGGVSVTDWSGDEALATAIERRAMGGVA